LSAWARCHLGVCVKFKLNAKTSAIRAGTAFCYATNFWPRALRDVRLQAGPRLLQSALPTGRGRRTPPRPPCEHAADGPALFPAHTSASGGVVGTPITAS
jgi:hypothetical protein